MGYLERQDKNYQQYLQAVAMQQRQQEIDRRNFEYANEPYRQAQDYQQRLQYEQSRMNQEFTTADNIRLQQLKQGQAWVDDQVANHGMTPETANEFQQMLSMPVSLLEKRQAFTRQNLEKQHMDQMAKQTTILDQNLQLHSKTAGERYAELPNGHGVFTSIDGKEHVMPPSQKATNTFNPDDMIGMAHQQALASRQDWQSDPQAAVQHPDYNAVYQRKLDTIKQDWLNKNTIPWTDPSTGQSVLLQIDHKKGIIEPIKMPPAPKPQGIPEEKKLADYNKQKDIVQKEYQWYSKRGPDGKFIIPESEWPDYMRTPELRDQEVRRRHADNMERFGKQPNPFSTSSASPAVAPGGFKPSTPTQTAAAGMAQPQAPQGPPPGFDAQAIGNALMQAASK